MTILLLSFLSYNDTNLGMFFKRYSFIVFLQVSLLDWDDTEYVAVYNSFQIGSEETDYELILSGYNATVSTLEDGFAAGGHINAKFATKDRDHNNCASQYTGGKSC
jgi:hypothetical protein